MSAPSPGNWQLVSVVDTGIDAKTVVVTAPGPQGPPGTGGGTGGGATALSQLTDVQVSSIGAGDVLSYDASSSKWKNAPRSEVTDGGNF